MQISVAGKNFHVSDALKQYAEEKLTRIERHYSNGASQAQVEFSVEKNPRIKASQRVQITMYTKGATIRSEESSEDMYASVDLAVDKLDRRLLRHKGKLQGRHFPKGVPADMMPAEEVPEEEAAPLPQIARTKHFSMKPVSIDEAILQLELLGHDFFAFRNADTGEINVLYRRRQGDIGIIEPEH